MRLKKLPRKFKWDACGPLILPKTPWVSSCRPKGLPDPDLCVRTAGEQRISNFLLWQMAYTEFYFANCYWPDFDAAALNMAVDEYYSRQRRFGLRDQVEDDAASDGETISV